MCEDAKKLMGEECRGLSFARLYSRFAKASVILPVPRPKPDLPARCRRALSRDKIQSRTPQRRDDFFYSVAENDSAIVDEMFEAVDGCVGRAFVCTLRHQKPSAVACESLETSGRRVRCPRGAIYARAVVVNRAPPASVLARRAPERLDGVSGEQFKSLFRPGGSGAHECRAHSAMAT